MQIPHIPVLYKETLEAFNDINDGYIIDCTTGFAGHSSGLISSNQNIKLILKNSVKGLLIYFFASDRFQNTEPVFQI